MIPHPKIITVSFPFPQFDNDLVSDESLKFVKEWDEIPGKSLNSIPGLDLVDKVSPNRPVQKSSHESMKTLKLLLLLIFIIRGHSMST